MSRVAAIVVGIIAGVVIGLIAIALLLRGCGARPAGDDPAAIVAEAGESGEAAPGDEAADAGDEASAEDEAGAEVESGAQGEPGAEGGEDAEDPATRVRKLPVTVYQRATTRALVLRGVPARIVWFDSPVDRARQLVRFVVDGVPARGAIKPAPPGLRYNDVFIDDRRTAWVDLSGETIGTLSGADVEESLVACLVVTLVNNLEEVRRVGILIDGQPRRTLAGHVDISRTFSGAEWPVASAASRTSAPRAAA